MKYVRYWIALAVMFSLISGAYAGVVQMDGGSQSSTKDGGGSAGWAHSFYQDKSDPNYIQADILAVASTIGIGKAWVKTEVPSLQQRTLTENGKDYELTVGAQGVVEAEVEGTNAAARVASVARIHSYAESDDAGTYAEGEASITSAIGDAWGQPWQNGANAKYQQASPEDMGNPVGQFTARSNAAGKAEYSSKATNVLPMPDEHYIATGSVEGTTTLEGGVYDNAGTIGEVIGSGFSMNEADGAAIATISANSRSTNGMGSFDWTSATVENEIGLAAVNNPTVSGAVKSYVAGTAAGKGTSFAQADDSNGLFSDRWYTAEASEDDVMSADVQVIKDRDAAQAESELEVHAGAGQPLSWASSDINTYTRARRLNAGSDPSGADRTWGQAFITSGTWNAQASRQRIDFQTADVDIATNAEISGALGTYNNAQGIGSGTFLQNNKNGDAWAELHLGQTAFSDTNGYKTTSSSANAEIMGPKANSLGSSIWDGSGVTAAFTNVKEEASRMWDFDPANGAISTDIATINGYMWVDGTNNVMYNGPGFEVPTDPTYVPSGYGSWTGLVWTGQNSPTQRRTTATFSTSQV